MIGVVVPGGRLVAAQAAHPGRLAGQRTVELADLDRRAAVLRVDLPQLLVLAGDGHHPQVEPVVAAHLLDRLERLGEVVAGVDEDDLDGRVDLHGEVDEHGVGHRRGQAEVRARRCRPPTG